MTFQLSASVLLLQLALLANDVSAQGFNANDTASIEQVIIRALPVPEVLQKIPGSISVISKKELQSNNGLILNPILNRVPGVFMQQGALNTNRITIRGIGARSQYGTDRIKAYINGIPLTAADGNSVIDDIDPDMLESIEIIKGPASSIYGAGLGGAIAMYTILPEQNRLTLSTSMGSFGFLKSSLGLSITGNRSAVNVGYYQLKNDGYRANNDYRRKSLVIDAQFQPKQGTTLTLFLNAIRLHAQIPSSLNATDYKNNPRSANANWAAAKGYESYDKWIVGLGSEHHFSENFLNTSSIFGQYRDGYEPRPFNILQDGKVGLGARTQFNYKHTFFGRPSELAFGGEFLREEYSVSLYENLYELNPQMESLEGSEINRNSQHRGYINLFVDQQWEVRDKILFNLGLGLNSTAYSLEDDFDRDSMDQSGNYRFPIITSPKIAARYQLTKLKTIYVSLSRGFSVPGVEETLTPDGAINTALLPEQGINIEAGCKTAWLDGKFYAEMAVFSMIINNLLVARRVAEDQYIGINAGKTIHNGIELSLGYKALLSDRFLVKPYLNSAINRFRFQDFTDDGQNYKGNALTGVPAQTINYGFEAIWVSGFSLRMNMLHVGQIPLNDGNTLYTEPYHLLNLKMGFHTVIFNQMDVEVFSGINNLSNTNYAASVLPNAIGFGGAEPRYFYPGDGRNIYGGIKVAWVK